MGEDLNLSTEREIVIDFIIAETERLFVREFNKDDVDAVLEYSSDPENTLFMPWGPESREGVVNFVDSRLKHQLDSPRFEYDFAVVLKETGELIGSIGLSLSKDRRQAELGYIFNKRIWGRGCASESARAMLQFGFMSLDLHRITARCDSENLASEAVMQRVGMRKEGEMRSCVFMKFRGHEVWRSEKLYAMLQKEFLNSLLD